MSAEQNIAFIHYLSNQLNQRNLAIVDHLYSPSFVGYNSPPGMPNNREALKQSLSMQWVAFPDMVSVIEDAVASETRVIVRGYTQGTQTGPFMSFPPSGRPFWIRSAEVYELAGGQVVGQWGVADLMNMVRQLQAPAKT